MRIPSPPEWLLVVTSAMVIGWAVSEMPWWWATICVVALFTAVVVLRK
jgi:hypothetical protein